MTEFEANRLSQDILNHLSPASRAVLKQRLDLGNLDMLGFLGLTIDGIPFDETERDPDCLMSFNAADAADLITKILATSIGEPSWTLVKHLGNIITIGMEADIGPLDTAENDASIIEFPRA